MAAPGDVIDEQIRVTGDPADAARRIIAVVEAAHSHQVMVEGPEVYRLVRKYRPAWAVPLVLVTTTETCAVYVGSDPARGGGVIRLVGRLPRTALAAIRLAVEEPPRYAPPARDDRWRTGDMDWSMPAHAATPQPPSTAAPLPSMADRAAALRSMQSIQRPGSPFGVPVGTGSRARTEPRFEQPAQVSVPDPVEPAPIAPMTADLTSTMQIPTIPMPSAPAPRDLSPLLPRAPEPQPATSGALVVPPLATAPTEVAARTADDPANRTIPRQQRAVAAARPSYAVVFDTGEQVRLDHPVIVGRAPALAPGEAGSLLAINDPDYSISKTHLAIGADSDGPWVMDRHSLNGTAIVRSEGEIACPPGERVLVSLGDTVYFGNRRFALRAMPADG